MIKQIKALGGLIAVLLVTGCANGPLMIDGLSANQQGNVIGSFDLVKNGHAVSLDSQPLGNRGTIHVSNASMQSIGTAKVGKDGRFSIDLAPGTYVIDTVAFEHQGEMIESQASFYFDIGDSNLTYIGAMTLEVSLENSALGVVGTADRMTVANGCDDCGAEISIMRWNAQTAQAQ